MDNPRPEKVAVVEEVRERLSSSSAAILTEYRGLGVKDLSNLRRSLSAAGGDYKIYKNTLVRFAARDLGLDELEAMLVGPTAIAFVDGDAAAVAKALRDFARTNPALVVKGGLLGSNVLSAPDAAALADLPSREVLLARIAGGFAAPMVKFAGLLQALPRNFAYGLKALLDQRGGAPEGAAAAEPAAPASETEAPAPQPEAAAPEPAAPEAAAPERAAPEAEAPAPQPEAAAPERAAPEAEAPAPQPGAAADPEPAGPEPEAPEPEPESTSEPAAAVSADPAPEHGAEPEASDEPAGPVEALKEVAGRVLTQLLPDDRADAGSEGSDTPTGPVEGLKRVVSQLLPNAPGDAESAATPSDPETPSDPPATKTEE